ncbi:hypothetical protein, conserved [Trypanosoma brucei gambiense DAL972]|uniref:Uncharacterized protein n=2 Tax=Trypanosoma brucei TaxID=5691 RepID=C9ZY70_TRYB9|nr:hypothetical protein, conserved [Trypanosoma brucei gambiense DAL972]RHW70606.1 hypothetical protein DPX39_090043000 [Trypanosoma brucei equiperdum]CBH14369.1 hypothetical protein, conserved [Trypanosoma brucei gambiense DAL972]|eukprot:XP_011776635.1 hypothetical protein, conserved [Trypanosoma brucei gambiense DAL972]
MGSDLSIVLRTCVAAPDCTKEENQSTPAADGGRDSEELKWYTELRLADRSSPEAPESILRSDFGVEPEVLIPECTLTALSELDTRDPKAFLRLKKVLCCPKCAGRVGLAVDSSASIGRRLHVAEHRRVFTQCLSALLSKLVLAMKDNVSDESREDQLARVKRESTPLDAECTLPIGGYELFLLDLQHCLLDDASGPWIVRDFLEHVGNSRHQHSAVSLVHDEQRSRSSSIMSFCLSPSARERLSTNYTSLQFLMAENDSNPPVSQAAEAAEQTFCKSLCYIRLSENNMSQIGMRKCVEELVGCKDKEKMRCLRSLRLIDVRQNEETVAAQRAVANLSSTSNIHILVGDSGLRWRYQSGVRYSVGLASRLGRSLSHTTDVHRSMLSEERLRAPSQLTMSNARFSIPMASHIGFDQRTRQYEDEGSAVPVGVVTDVLPNTPLETRLAELEEDVEEPFPRSLHGHIEDTRGNDNRCLHSYQQNKQHQSKTASAALATAVPENDAEFFQDSDAADACSEGGAMLREPQTFLAAPHPELLATTQMKREKRGLADGGQSSVAPRISARRTIATRDTANQNKARFLRTDKPTVGRSTSSRTPTSERATARTARPQPDSNRTNKTKGVATVAAGGGSLKHLSREPPKRVK